MQQRRATWLVNARTERERTRERTRERKIDKRTDSQTHTNSLSLTHTQRRTKLNACVHQRASLCFVYHVASIWQLYIPQTHPHPHLNSTRHQHPPKQHPHPHPRAYPPAHHLCNSRHRRQTAMVMRHRRPMGSHGSKIRLSVLGSTCGFLAFCLLPLLCFPRL